MPSLHLSIECTSPVINYDRSWTFGTSQDAFADQYTISSFTLTSSPNSIASFTFNGTSVALVGSRRTNHGSYQAQVDNDPSSLITGNGQSDNPLFNQTLYSWSGPQGLHTVTLENIGTSFLDIDYISFTTNIGEDGESLITDTYQESHPAFSYSPPASWVPGWPPGMFSGGSGIQTSDMHAVATFKFIGDGIAVHGPIGTGFAVPYAVSLDGGPSTTYAPSLIVANVTMPRELLYFASNLGKGEHTITFQLAQSPSSGQALAIDYAEVFTTPSIGSSYTSAANPPPSQVSGSNSTASAASPGVSHSTVMKFKIALVVTSGIAGIALIALVFVLLTSWRWRRQDTNERTGEGKPDAPSPYRLGPQSPEMGTQPLAVPGTTYNPYDPDSLRLANAPPGNRPYHQRGQESMSSGLAMSSSTASETLPLARTGKGRFSFRGGSGRRQSRAPPAYSPVSPEALS